MGRAYLALQADPNLHPETLLEACLYDWRYDWQCEYSRVPYLGALVRLTGRPDFFRKPLFASLNNPTTEPTNEDEKVYQRYELVRWFAQQGDAEARTVLYAVCTREAEQGDFENLDELVTLDGLDGLLYALQQMQSADAETFVDQGTDLLWTLKKRDGEENAHEAVAQAARTRPELNALVEASAAQQAQY